MRIIRIRVQHLTQFFVVRAVWNLDVVPLPVVDDIGSRDLSDSSSRFSLAPLLRLTRTYWPTSYEAGVWPPRQGVGRRLPGAGWFFRTSSIIFA